MVKYSKYLARAAECLLCICVPSQFSANTTPVIKIGRMPDCEIKIEDNLLSKYQSTIKYISSSGWTLFDGFNNKSSTNSNWLYLNDDFEIHNNMIFKANHTLFQVKSFFFKWNSLLINL